MSLGPIACVTFSAPDLDAVEEAYTRWLGYQVRDRTTVSDDAAAVWGAPAAAGAGMLLMGPHTGEDVFLRFVEGPAVDGYAPLMTHGWHATEIVVADVDGLEGRLAGSPFAIIGPPADLSITDKVRAMQVTGPAGEVLYLTQVKEPVPGFDLPQAGAGVERVFIVVAGGPDLGALRDFYGRALGLSSSEPAGAVVSVLSDAHGLPAEALHDLSTVQLDGACLVELDQFPASARDRPVADGALPPGMAMVSLLTDDLGGRDARALAGRVYGGRRACVCRGGAGELIELIER